MNDKNMQGKYISDTSRTQKYIINDKNMIDNLFRVHNDSVGIFTSTNLTCYLIY